MADKPVRQYKEMLNCRPREAKRTPRATVKEPATKEAINEVVSHRKDSEAEVSTIPENRLMEVSSDLGIAFPECIRNRYKEDKFFEAILTNPGEFTNFFIEDSLVFFVSEEMRTITVLDVKVGGEQVREVLIKQAHSKLAHLGGEKTATYMRDQVWWKTMVDDITTYCCSCHTCATSKPQQGKPHGKLKTMLVPSHPWQYIGIDFVGPLSGNWTCRTYVFL